jgi:predicted MFS family arabinose efflux permease
MQLGYFTGSMAAGATLAVGGYPAFGAAMGALFLLAALVLTLPAERRPRIALGRAHGCVS